MDKYPVFKSADLVNIKREIWETVHDGRATRVLEMHDYQGTIVQRQRRSKGRPPLYTVLVGPEVFSIYANFLEKREEVKPKKKWRFI